MGIYWECQRCTACCRWPGEVRISDAEISLLAAFLGLEETEFIQRYTRLRQDRRGLALAEQSDGACVFLQGQDCLVQPVKPRQCREFPNGWRADDDLMRKCQARPLWREDTTFNPPRETVQSVARPIKAP